MDLLRLALAARVRLVPERATRVDVHTREIVTESGERVPADVAVLDVGGESAAREHAGNAVLAKPALSLARLGAWLDGDSGQARTLVLVGGGAAGTEIALNVSARFPREALRVTLVEPADRLLPEFSASLGRRALQLLRERGVDVRLGAQAETAHARGVTLRGGEDLHADAVVWATGTGPHPLPRASGLPLTHRGLVRVGRDLRVEGSEWLLASGDCAAVAGHEHLARSGVHAVKQGPALLANADLLVRAVERGDDLARVRLAPWRPYPVAPYLVSTGASEALCALGPVGLRGRAFLALKHRADGRWLRRYDPNM